MRALQYCYLATDRRQDWRGLDWAALHIGTHPLPPYDRPVLSFLAAGSGARSSMRPEHALLGFALIIALRAFQDTFT
jgi:hypothetical protein